MTDQPNRDVDPSAEAHRHTTLAAGPLKGVRILEAATFMSAPFASLALADLGAHVDKLEPPSGDAFRRIGPQDSGDGLMFQNTNRNKHGIVADLKQPDGLAAFESLLDDADVLMTNWRPAVAAGFGLTDESFRTRWPSKIWMRVSGYGPDGPVAHEPTFDSIIQARTGTATIFGDDQSRLVPMYLVDKVAAMIVTQTVLAALFERSRTGRGHVVDVSMLDAMAYFNAPDVFARESRIGRPAPTVVRHLCAPRPVAAADGALMLTPVTGKQLKRALVAAGLEHRVPELRAVNDSTEVIETFYAMLDEELPTRPVAEWLERFRQADVPVTEVLTVAQHLQDPQVVHNGMYRVVDEHGRGPTWRVRYPALFDGQPVVTDDTASPTLP